MNGRLRRREGEAAPWAWLTLLFWLERGQSKAVKEQDFFHALKGRPCHGEFSFLIALVRLKSFGLDLAQRPLFS